MPPQQHDTNYLSSIQIQRQLDSLLAREKRNDGGGEVEEGKVEEVDGVRAHLDRGPHDDEVDQKGVENGA